MLTKTDLETLAQIRLEDSLLLFQANRSSSAYYLCGYAVELALKACIAALIQANTIPEKGFINAIYTHRLESLLSTAGLLPQFQVDTKANRNLLRTGPLQANGQRKVVTRFGTRCRLRP
jgi:hypothetical protein